MKRDELAERIREMIQKTGPAKLIILIVSGVLLLLLSYGNLPAKEETDGEERTGARKETSVEDEMLNYKNTMEEQVKAILEKVEGVDDVDVMITLRASGEKVTLKDNTANGERSEEESVLIQDEDDKTSPYVVQEAEPEIEGVLVVCAGGGRPSVQREIIDGISALFPIESHKIKVMKSKEAK